MFVSNALVRLAVRVSSRAARELTRQSMAAWREVWECAAHARALVRMFWGRAARKTAYRAFVTWLQAADDAMASRTQAQVQLPNPIPIPIPTANTIMSRTSKRIS